MVVWRNAAPPEAHCVLSAGSPPAAEKTRCFVVLMYHAVGKSFHCVSPDAFEAHMSYLKAHARVISLDAMLNGQCRHSTAPLTCAITFDDWIRRRV